MAIQTLPTDLPLLVINTQNGVTQARLEVNPLTAGLAVPFSDFRTQRWVPVFLQEVNLHVAVAQAKARIQFIGRKLDGLVNKLDATLQVITGKDTSAPVYQQFFGAHPPFEVCKPEIEPQLKTMRGWIDQLAILPQPELQNLGAEIASAVNDADQAVNLQTDAVAALHAFETTGERVKMIEECNALRKSTYGELGKILHQHPELPSGFADAFFLHETRKRDDKLSSQHIQDKIDALQGDVDAWKDKLAAALAREKAEADAKAQKAAKEAELAGKKKQAEALAAEIKKLEDDVSS